MLNRELYQYFTQRETPFYYYDIALFHQTLHELKKASDKHNFLIHYAIKANSNDRILQTIKDFGFGFDCVSGNEVKKALETGVHSNMIAFAGVGKSDKEIKHSIDHNIYSLIVNPWKKLR